MAQALATLLPRPKNWVAPTPERMETESTSLRIVAPTKKIPSYGNRKGFIPRTLEDFGDGGAFPEIHVAQYPLDMGRKETNAKSNALPVTLDASGQVKFEAILGHGSKQIVHAKSSALFPGEDALNDLARPTEEEEAETTAKTRAALEGIVNGKVMAARPSQPAQKKGAPTYVRYTPQSSDGTDSGAQSRIIRMVEMPSDPMEPPKFKHKKVPGGPPSPPAPVMHSPPRKLTVEDQQAWKIPPCISNWKNAKGYTIPLDKRLAADGRGLQEVQINDNFAKLSEALYIAERRAREEVTRRVNIQKTIAEKDRSAKEETLRQLADQARKSRSGAEEQPKEELDEDETLAKKERDELRYERKRERDRQRHLDNYAGTKKSKLDRDADRDVSEKIALGEAPKASNETMYDQRLFNQAQGMDSGFGSEDSYNIYDKPLFKGSSANFLYRPRNDADDDTYGGGGEGKEGDPDTAKFRPDRGFSGVDRGRKGPTRSKPVEFERAEDAKQKEEEEEEEEDPFGLDSFLSEVKTDSRKRPLDKIGTSRQMHAAGGGSKDTLSNRANIAFEASEEKLVSIPETTKPARSPEERDSGEKEERRERESRRDRDRDRDSHRERDRDRDSRRDRDRDRDSHRDRDRDRSRRSRRD